MAQKEAQIVVYLGTGRRKTSVARVRLTPGIGNFTVNGGKSLEEYFPRASSRIIINKPFVVTGVAGRFNVHVTLNGGGKSSQAGALAHGIARALAEASPDLRPDLKKAGLLTRDPRMIERKKYGLKKARKKPQFSKR